MKTLGNFVGISAICISLLLSSCGGKSIDSCGGSTPKPVHYLVNHYDATLVRYPKAIDDQFYLASPALITGSQPVEWKAFSIEIKAKWQIYSGFRWPQVSLFSQAMACSPVESALQKLTKISITSANDFSDKYPAGSELLDLFGSVDNASTRLAVMLVNAPAPLDLKLKLLVAPQNARQNFEAQITLDDGNVYVLRMGDVYFNLP